MKRRDLKYKKKLVGVYNNALNVMSLNKNTSHYQTIVKLKRDSI